MFNAHPNLQFALDYILPLAAFVFLFALIDIWSFTHKIMNLNIKERELRLRDKEFYLNNRT